MEIGSKLKEARIKRELTQEQVAETIGVSRQTMSNWENNKSYPDIISVIKLSDIYEISLDYLLKGKGQTPMTGYLNYLDESTNMIKSKQKFSKLIQIGIYLVLWTACLIWFWLEKGEDGGFAMAYSLATFYLILPVTTFVLSVQIGKDVSWGKLRWIMSIFFGVMFSLEGFCTFKMANTLAFGNQHVPSIADGIPGFVISVLGLFIGWQVKLFKERKYMLDENAKFTDEQMKVFDSENKDEVAKKYISKECTIGIMEVLSELDDRSIQLILKEINNTTLLYALAGASGKVCIRFMQNLSGRMLRFIDEKLQTEEFEEEMIKEAQISILQIASVINK